MKPGSQSRTTVILGLQDSTRNHHFTTYQNAGGDDTQTDTQTAIVTYGLQRPRGKLSLNIACPFAQELFCGIPHLYQTMCSRGSSINSAVIKYLSYLVMILLKNL